MTRDFRGKRYWIVGASEGLGRALALELGRAGAKLVLSARNEERLESLSAELGGARVVALDVTDTASVLAATEAAFPVDGIVYCVGLYEPMTASDWEPTAAEMMVDANFTGALRLLGRVFPRMIQRDRGHVVLIGSLAGYRGLSGAIGYGASKAALMHLAENLYAETRGTGVLVQLANPGFIRTRLTDKNDFKMPCLMSPEGAALKVFDHMRGNRFRLDFPRPFSWLFTVGRFIPAGLFYRLFGARR